jgi:hypothetical protein
VQLHSFLISALGTQEWPALGHFIPGEGAAGDQQKRKQGIPITCITAERREQSIAPSGRRTPFPQSYRVQSIYKLSYYGSIRRI